MFWTEDKLYARIVELKKYRYRNTFPIREFRYSLDEKGEIGSYPPVKVGNEKMKIGDCWSGRDQYIWLFATIQIPGEWKGETVLGLFDFGKTGEGNTSGFESLLFVNHEPYQGVDVNHKEVFFPKEFIGKRIDLAFRLWSGLEGGGIPQPQEHRINYAAIACLDEATDDLFWTGKAMIETIKILDENRPERQQLLTILDQAFFEIDWSKPGSEIFYNSVKKSRTLLKEGLNHLEKHHSVTVYTIGHTHIDMAWLWRLRHTREKGARSFSTVINLMNMYPDYFFLQTSPQLYEYIKRDYPELYGKIKEKIKEGKWEAGGGMWLEADTNIPSGESLVRQILYGKRFFEKEFGVNNDYVWLPDVFGYSWALPQIFKKSGIRTFMTTKISWSQYNRMPHDTFYWRGIDGTDILTHFITTPDGGDWWYYTYNGEINPKTIQGIWNSYRDKEINEDLLLSYGYGDGGGGVNREMLEMRRRLNKMPGLPNVIPSRVDDYFNKLHEKISATDRYVHTWDGELYLEYHRGTYTSQGFIKRMNRKLELFLREVEWLASLNRLFDRDWSRYPVNDLDKAWKIVLRNQFHDILPGTSIYEVYEDSISEYEQAEKLLIANWNLNAVVELQGTGRNEYTVYNSSSWPRNDLLEIPNIGNTNVKWMDVDGNRLEAQKTDNGWLVYITELPSMGFKPIQWEESESEAIEIKDTPFIIEKQGIETPFYKIEWNSQGHVTQIFDKGAKRQVFKNKNCGNVFQIFEDKPIRYDSWDIDLFYQEKMKIVDELVDVRFNDKGPLRASVQFTWKFQDSMIKQTMYLYKYSRRIDFETSVDWHERQQLLKVAFPVDIRATEATYDIQFGNIKRPTHWNTSWDYAKFESIGHQWADLSERNYGVSLLNDCKYGYDIKENVLRLTLIKSAIFPDPQADQGEHFFTYALLPHKGDWFEANTVQEAWNLNNPLRFARGVREERQTISMLRTDNNHVLIDTVKKAEDENQIIVRLHEFTGARGRVTLSSDFKINSWQECDLMEKPLGQAKMNIPIEFSIKPYEIKTLMVKFE